MLAKTKSFITDTVLDERSVCMKYSLVTLMLKNLIEN
jgi:hypothetical protein